MASFVYKQITKQITKKKLDKIIVRADIVFKVKLDDGSCFEIGNTEIKPNHICK